MQRSPGRTSRRVALTIIAGVLWFPAASTAGQARDSASDRMIGMADGAMDMSAMDHADANMSRHMLMSPRRAATHADSARALELVTTIRQAIGRYADTAAAAADGYRMFLPNVKNQPVYHFTNRWHALGEAFRFDPAKPTSLLYKRAPDGAMRLVGAMYTAPKRWSPDRLDARIPLSIATWHQHVNWCLPPRGEQQRWRERHDGQMVFGPQSPIATRAACDSVGGNFRETVFGWMVHVNVFEGNDLASVFADDHGQQKHAH